MLSFSSLSYLHKLCLLFSCKSSTFLSNLTLFILLYNSYLALSDTVKACFIVFDLLLKGNPLTTLASDNLRILFHLQARWCSGGPAVPSWSSALASLLFSNLWAPSLGSPPFLSVLGMVHYFHNILFFETVSTWFSFPCWDSLDCISFPVIFISLWQVQFSSILNPLSYPTALCC